MSELSTIDILDAMTRQARKNLGLDEPDREGRKVPKNTRPLVFSSETASQEGFSQESSFNTSPPLELQTKQIQLKRNTEQAARRIKDRQIISQEHPWRQAMIAKEILDAPLSKRNK